MPTISCIDDARNYANQSTVWKESFDLKAIKPRPQTTPESVLGADSSIQGRVWKSSISPAKGDDNLVFHPDRWRTRALHTTATLEQKHLTRFTAVINIMKRLHSISADWRDS